MLIIAPGMDSGYPIISREEEKGGPVYQQRLPMPLVAGVAQVGHPVLVFRVCLTGGEILLSRHRHQPEHSVWARLHVTLR